MADSSMALTPKLAEIKTKIATKNSVLSKIPIICQSSDNATPGNIADKGSCLLLLISRWILNVDIFELRPNINAVMLFGVNVDFELGIESEG